MDFNESFCRWTGFFIPRIFVTYCTLAAILKNIYNEVSETKLKCFKSKDFNLGFCY